MPRRASVDVGDLDLARAPAAFGRLEHVRRRVGRRLRRRLPSARPAAGSRGFCDAPAPSSPRAAAPRLPRPPSGRRRRRASDRRAPARGRRRARAPRRRSARRGRASASRAGSSCRGAGTRANLSRHLCVKPSSPTASTSSTSSTSGIDVDRHGEAEPHVHAGRVGLHRRVDELAQLGEVDDLVEALLDLALRQAEHDAVDEDVLAAGDLGVKAGAELDERRDAAVDAHGAARRLRDAGDELQRRALARAVAADDAEGASPSARVNDTSVQRRERLARLQIAQDAALEQRALERGELPAAVAAVDLRDVRRARWRGVIPPPRTSRAADRTASSRRGTRTTDATPSASSHFQWPTGPGKNRISWYETARCVNGFRSNSRLRAPRRFVWIQDR